MIVPKIDIGTVLTQERLGLFRRSRTLRHNLQMSTSREPHLENMDLRHGRVSSVRYEGDRRPTQIAGPSCPKRRERSHPRHT